MQARLKLFFMFVVVMIPTAALAEGDAKSTEGTLVVDVADIESDKGSIGCSLFAKADGFPSDADKALASMFVKPEKRKATCTFTNVKPGTYAVSVMHDLNDDGKLEKGAFGKPKEPWGVSNDAPAERFGPPKFESASFKYSGKQTGLTIKLHE